MGALQLLVTELGDGRVWGGEEHPGVRRVGVLVRLEGGGGDGGGGGAGAGAGGPQPGEQVVAGGEEGRVRPGH